VDPQLALHQDDFRTVGAGAALIRHLALQSGERGYRDVLAALTQALTDALDSAAIAGSGGAEPTGLLGQAKIQTHAASGTGPAGFAEAIELLADAGFTRNLRWSRPRLYARRFRRPPPEATASFGRTTGQIRPASVCRQWCTQESR